MSIKSYKFNNGLNFVYQKNTTGLSAINIFVKVGSINEPAHLNGVSHFIEHMVFKGTEKRQTSDEITQVFDSIGAYINAGTTLDHTFYTSKCDSDYLEVCLETLLDMVFNSKLEKSEIKNEKAVVIEEINMTKDSPYNLTAELAYKILFSGSSLSQPVGGIDSVIEGYRYDDIVAYYKHFYRPENMVVSICSNIAFSKIKKIIKKNNKCDFLKLSSPDKFKPCLKLKLPKKQMVLKNIPLEKTYLALGFRVCSRYDEDFYLLDIVRIILSGNMSSLLFVELREKNGLTYSVSIDYDTFDNIGNFIILTNVDKNRLLKKGNKNGALSVIIDVLKTLKSDGVTTKQLKIAKGYLKGILTLSVEDTSTISQINGNRYLFNQNDKKIPLQEIYEKRYKNITVKQVNRVINKYFIKKNMSSVYLGKKVINIGKQIKATENTL